MLIIQFQIAAGEKEHGVEVREILRVEFELFPGQRFGVCADRRIPQPGLFAEPLNRGHSVRNRLVPVSLFFANDKKMLLLVVSRMS